MTWDEIYKAADGTGFGDPELTRKDTARYEVVCFVEENFGFNLEDECDNGLIEIVEEWIDDYTERYNIIFDEDGHIVGHSKVELKDRAAELVMFYDDLPDRDDKEFDTLDIALKILRELNDYF